MIRNETYQDGQLIAAEVIDVDAGTISFEDKGVVKSTRALTAEEVARYTPATPEQTPEEKLALVKAAIADLKAVPAPILAADVAEALIAIEEVL